MDALSVVSQLRDLASEPQNRAVIVQDQGCLPGLVLFLDHQNPEVLLATLQVGDSGCTGAIAVHYTDCQLFSHLKSFLIIYCPTIGTVCCYDMKINLQGFYR